MLCDFSVLLSLLGVSGTVFSPRAGISGQFVMTVTFGNKGSNGNSMDMMDSMSPVDRAPAALTTP